MKKIIFISFLFAINALFAQKKYDYHPEFDKVFNKADSVNFITKDYNSAIEIYKSIINTNGDFEDLLRCKLNSYVALSRIYKNTQFDGSDFNLAYVYLKKAVEARNIYRIKAGFKTEITSDSDDLARSMAELTQKYPGCENGTYVSAIAKVDNKALKKDTTFTSTQTTTNSDKTVTIKVNGSGKSQVEAKQSALRSAIQQAFGAFISAKTEILNDQLISDQISSVASGNIQSFDILNASQLPDGTWSVIIKAIVSIDKLTSFVEAKGVAIEIKGGLFAINIKQQLLNEQGEIKAISEMVDILHQTMQIAYDYSIKSDEPISVDDENKKWEIPLTVTATANKNMDFCADYCNKTLSAISLTENEVANYKSLNKEVFTVLVNCKDVSNTFYLRRESSIKALNTHANQWESYKTLFTVDSSIDESNGNGESENHNSSKNDKDLKINYLTTGQQAAKFSWKDKRTLAQIEQMTGYKIKPRGEISSTVTDIDGNVYRTLIIGTKVWMAENLKVTKYNDGTPILNIANNALWAAQTTGAYCDYDNNPTNSTTYGRLYNWHAVNTGKLAPKGWHVTKGEECPPEFKAIFSNVLLGGSRKTYGGGMFHGVDSSGCWWTSEPRENWTAYYMYIFHHTNSFYDYTERTDGFSVRCIKDNL